MDREIRYLVRLFLGNLLSFNRNSMSRAEKEEKRGIVRDESGRIVRSKEWVENRIAMLKSKRKDCEQRIANIDSEIAERKKELKK